MRAQLPPNESERLAELASYRLVDTPPEPAFEDLTYVASYVCATPISLVSLVTEHRQWFKSERGLGVRDTHRDLSFCSHAILKPEETFVVEDASRDPRFSDNELVTGEQHLRFYAGAPLVTPEGNALGTVCVLDRKPRKLDEEQLECLRRLSRQAVAQLLLRRNVFALRDANSKLERTSAELRADREDLRNANEALRSFDYMVSHDLRAPVRRLLQLAHDVREDVVRGGTPDAKLLDRIEREGHALDAIVQGLLRLSRATHADIHLQEVDLAPIARRIVAQLHEAEPWRVVDFEAPQSARVVADPDLATVLLQNLLENAWKYSRDRRVAHVALEVRGSEGAREFAVRDNGPGIPAADAERVFLPFTRMRATSALPGTGIGLTTVRRIAERHGGDAWIDPDAGAGTTVRFTFGAAPPQARATSNRSGSVV